MPLIFLHFPGFIRVLPSACMIPLLKTSFTKEDFPEPLTPVTTVKVPNGSFTLTFFRLFSLAPTTSSFFPFPFLLFFGTSIFNFPLKYCPVKEFGFAITSSGVPAATTFPP